MERNATKLKPITDHKRPRRYRYLATTYCHALYTACLKVESSTWSQNQLRYTAATEIRREHGIEMARILLGHKTAYTTEFATDCRF